MHTEHTHAHTCTHMHAHAHMQTFELCNSAFIATIRANASLDMLKPTLLWDTQRSIFFFFSQCKRQQGAGHFIDTNKLLSIWKSVYTRMWTSTTLKKNQIPDVSWCLIQQLQIWLHCKHSSHFYLSETLISAKHKIVWTCAAGEIGTIWLALVCDPCLHHMKRVQENGYTPGERLTGLWVTYLVWEQEINTQVRQMASIFSKPRAGHFISLSCHYFENCICVLFLPHVFGALCWPKVQF